MIRNPLLWLIEYATCHYTVPPPCGRNTLIHDSKKIIKNNNNFSSYFKVYFHTALDIPNHSEFCTKKRISRRKKKQQSYLHKSRFTVGFQNKTHLQLERIITIFKQHIWFIINTGSLELTLFLLWDYSFSNSSASQWDQKKQFLSVSVLCISLDWDTKGRKLIKFGFFSAIAGVPLTTALLPPSTKQEASVFSDTFSGFMIYLGVVIPQSLLVGLITGTDNTPLTMEKSIPDILCSPSSMEACDGNQFKFLIDKEDTTANVKNPKNK